MVAKVSYLITYSYKKLSNLNCYLRHNNNNNIHTRHLIQDKHQHFLDLHTFSNATIENMYSTGAPEHQTPAK